MAWEDYAVSAIGTLADVRLAECRQRRRMSQAELAAAAGVAPSTIYKLEKGLHRPQNRVARRIAAALQVEPDEIDELRLGLPPAE
jgi:transcriptional regulator with XRE-family HTH domain